MKLSILIPTIPEHEMKLKALLMSLNKQKTDDLEILTYDTLMEKDGGFSTGEKRNKLIDCATGEYVVFVDADDVVSTDYVEQILKAIESGSDVITFDVLYRKRNFSKTVKYSINYRRDGENQDYYERLPNHLMVVKRKIAKKVKFKHITFGEDADYARRLHANLRTEKNINKILYYYIDTK